MLLQDLGLNLKTHLTLQKIEPPAPRKAGIKVKDVKELIENLKMKPKYCNGCINYRGT